MIKLDLTTAMHELKKLKAKTVLLQVPEGLKTKVDEVIEELEEKGFEVIALMNPCFGACDVRSSEAKRLGCDAVLHLGHTAFVQKTSVPVVYAPLKYELGKEFGMLLDNLAVKLKEKNARKVGLVTTAQFLGHLSGVQKSLGEKGIRAIIGKGKRVEDGQVLGCNYSSADVGGKEEAIIFLGDGLFHPLGIHFATQKPVFMANPLTLEVRELLQEKDDFLRRRITLIEHAKQAKKFGIIVSTKEGQNRISEAEEIKKALEKKGKKAKIYAMDFISQEALLGIKVDALINTACPRISIDDYANYKWPMINKNEVDYLLGKKGYEKYQLELIY